MSYRSAHDLLHHAGLFVANAQTNEIIREAFEGIGRGSGYFAEAEELVQRVQRLCGAQSSRHGVYRGTTQHLRETRREAQRTYMRHLKLARLALGDAVSARESLVLDGERARRLDAWLAQAEAFYENALAVEAYRAALAGFGVTDANLKEGQRQIQAVAAKREEQRRALGEAKAATRRRDEALAELRAWLSENRRLARILLGNDQALEAVGIVVPSR